METERICPNCRKPLPPDVPLGLCPECLIKSGFATEAEPDAGGIGRFVPPPVEEIARLFPQFEILGFIGKGGMGAVYKARQPALDRLVALKVLPPSVASDPGFAERFNREARALAKLSHPNIVVVYDFGKADALHYLVMEFVDGTNLREVERAGRLSPEQALAIVPQICEALQFAHNEGIVHRDIKPENLLLDKKGRVKITDFGIAKILNVPAGKAALTGAKEVMGTPHYMAPEQIEKPQTVDHRADIYSLGVVFYEMLTGELPLGKFAPPSKKVQMDVRLDEVVMHALEKEPERRYQQAGQVKTDVETISGTRPIAGAAAVTAGAPPLIPASPQQAVSDKIILPAFLLAFFFGVFGAHRFYVGKIGTGVLQLFTLGGLGIWATIDWILILCKAFTDGNGRRITNWWHPPSGPPKPAKPPQPPKPPSPPVISGNLFGQAFGGSAPMIVAPALALMVSGFVKLFGALPMLLFGRPFEHFTLSHVGVFLPFHGGPFFGLSIVLFVIAPAVVMIYGAAEMMRCGNYAWAVIASVVAIVFCSTLGLPVGIWALIVLLLPGVRASFTDAPVELASEKWLKILGGTGAAGLLLFLIAGLVSFLHEHPGGSSAAVTLSEPMAPAMPAPPAARQEHPSLARAPQANARRQILEVQLNQAEWELTNTQARYSIGLATSEDAALARDKVDTLKAELAGNAIQAAHIELATAKRQLDLKSQRLKIGLGPSNEVVRAQTNLTLAQSHLKELQHAPGTGQTMSVSTTVSQAPPLSYQWYYNGTTNGPVSNSDPAPTPEVIEAGDSTDLSQSFDVGPAGKLAIDADRGDVQITGADQTTVTIHLTRDVTGADDPDAAQILKDEHVRLEQNGNDISITAQTPRRLEHWSFFNHPNLDVHYEITLPRQFAVHAATMGGDVDVSGIQAGADIKTLGGNLVSENIGGDVNARTMGGDVRAEGCQGRLDLQTMGGSVTVDGFTGPAVHATTSGGSVSADFAAAPIADSELDTSGGNITVRLPGNAALTLEGHTLGGSEKSDFPLQIKDEFGNGTLNGAINGGGPLLKMETAGGNVEVFKN